MSSGELHMLTKVNMVSQKISKKKLVSYVS